MPNVGYSGIVMHPQTNPQIVFTNIGIIGLGLVGGSLAKALRSLAHVGHIIVGDTNRATLDSALADGCADLAVDMSGPDAISSFNGCDVLFICTPPHAASELVGKFKNSAIGIITDVTSVKVPIMNAASGMVNFIGGHPMAGSEGSGYSASDTGLFQRSTYVLCVPESCTLPESHIDAFKKLLESIGASPTVMDPVAHDCRVAVISHLPHVAAFALSCIAEESHDATMRALIGGGFRDTTRIAASSPALWTDIMSESANLVTAIEEYVNILCRIRDLLVTGKKKELQALLKTSSDFRASIPEGLRSSKHGGHEQ